MSDPTSHASLDPRTLASIGSIELRARMVVEGLMTGMHRSPAQGFSVEFAQHRQYVPGDDTRFLDWKVYGKTDKLYLKQYQKETNLDLVLLVDHSGSMGYGGGRGRGAEGQRGKGKGNKRDKRNKSTPSAPGPLDPSAPSGWTKFDAAITVAAAMAHLGLKQQDRVAATMFAESIHQGTRLSNGSGQFADICHLLQRVRPEVWDEKGGKAIPPQAAPAVGLNSAEDTSGGGGRASGGGGHTDLGRVFEQELARLTRRSLIVLISDLFDDPARLDAALARLHHRRHDVILIQVLDRAELDLPMRDPCEFLGLEDEGVMPLDPAALREAYREVVAEHQAKIAESARRFRFDHVRLLTDEPLGPALSHFLARRSAITRSKA